MEHRLTVSIVRLFPKLRSLPHLPLAQVPTPVMHLENLADQLGVGRLYLKNDGVSARPIGGNKVRKLEFLLAAAREQGADTVLTFGGCGSNHAAATAVFANQMGLGCISILADQPNAHAVGRNLLLGASAGAKLVHCSDFREMTALAEEQKMHCLAESGREPYIIPPGGSSELGTVGYVNAGFELAAQIEAGVLPEPDVIFVALGTCGTVTGLALGLRAAGVKSTVVGVRVVPSSMANPERIEALGRGTAALLTRYDSTFARSDGVLKHVEIDNGQFGKEYARYTRASVDAVQLVAATAGVNLEGTYTGKAFAALAARARSGTLHRKTVLFLNTHNQHDFSEQISTVDFRSLPVPFHRYFTGPVQALDRK